MRNVERVVGSCYPPMVNAIKAALAVIAVRCIANNSQPTTLVFVGPPSSGKSMVLEWMTPKEIAPAADGKPAELDALAEFFYRSDKFTAASFVTQSGDVKKAELAQTDLLPRIENKTLLTPELGPVFSGSKEALVERLAVLVRALDGQGLTTDAGTHGQRGYNRPMNFQWLGATTPVQPDVLAAMSKLGPRILYYSVPNIIDAHDELAAMIADEADNESAKRTCRRAVVAYVHALYKAHPLGSLHTSRTHLPPALQAHVVSWSLACCGLRAPLRPIKGIGIDDYDEPNTSCELSDEPEKPYRMLGLANRLVRASAIAHGRQEVTPYDLSMLRHIVVSSGVSVRGDAFNALLAGGGVLRTDGMMDATGWSRKTALLYMRQLQACRLATVTEAPTGKRPTLEVTLVETVRGLLSAPAYGDRMITKEAA